MDLGVAGTYTLTSDLHAPATVLAPESVAMYLQALAGLRDNPARTLFALADAAGVPLVDDLNSALPGPARDRLEGWINEYFASAVYNNQSARTAIDGLVTLASATLADVRLDTTLVLAAPDAATGTASASHTLVGLSFAPPGGAELIAIPQTTIARAGDLLAISANPTCHVTGDRVGAAMADGRLEIGDHAFGVPYGRYAYEALEVIVRRQYGVSLRELLGQILGCEALATNVSQRCVNLGVTSACVGHATELRGICDAGLDAAVADVRARLLAQTWNAVRLQRGEGRLWDAPAAGGPGAPADRRIDRVSDGVWLASIDAGMGARPTPATFAGTVAAR
jgi:hypothetical protein